MIQSPTCEHLPLSLTFVCVRWYSNGPKKRPLMRTSANYCFITVILTVQNAILQIHICTGLSCVLKIPPRILSHSVLPLQWSSRWCGQHSKMHAECWRPYSGTSAPTQMPSINSPSCTHLHGERRWASNGNSVPLILFKRAQKVPHAFWTPRRHEDSFNLVLCPSSLFELVLPGFFFVVRVLPGAVMSAACVGVR